MHQRVVPEALPADTTHPFAERPCPRVGSLCLERLPARPAEVAEVVRRVCRGRALIDALTTQQTAVLPEQRGHTSSRPRPPPHRSGTLVVRPGIEGLHPPSCVDLPVLSLRIEPDHQLTRLLVGQEPQPAAARGAIHQPVHLREAVPVVVSCVEPLLAVTPLTSREAEALCEVLNRFSNHRSPSRCSRRTREVDRAPASPRIGASSSRDTRGPGVHTGTCTSESRARSASTMCSMNARTRLVTLNSGRVSSQSPCESSWGAPMRTRFGSASPS